MFDGLRSRWTIEIGVRVRHRVSDLQEQLEARAPYPVAARRQYRSMRVAFDVFEDQVRLRRGRDSGIEQSRDVRMREPREHRALALEPFVALTADERQVEELDGDETLEAAVASPGAPHGPHAAHAQRDVEGIRAHGLTQPMTASGDRRGPAATPRNRNREVDRVPR